MIKINKGKGKIRGTDEEILVDFALLVKVLNKTHLTEDEIKQAFDTGMQLHKIASMLDDIDPKLNDLFNKVF